MIRALAQWAAKKYYLFNQEYQAAIADLHAGLSLKLAAEKRSLIATLNREADEIEANIKSVDEKLHDATPPLQGNTASRALHHDVGG
jgi:hypothetical protein